MLKWDGEDLKSGLSNVQVDAANLGNIQFCLSSVASNFKLFQESQTCTYYAHTYRSSNI